MILYQLPIIGIGFFRVGLERGGERASPMILYP